MRTFIPVALCIHCHKPVDAQWNHQFRISQRFHILAILAKLRGA